MPSGTGACSSCLAGCHGHGSSKQDGVRTSWPRSGWQDGRGGTPAAPARQHLWMEAQLRDEQQRRAAARRRTGRYELCTAVSRASTDPQPSTLPSKPSPPAAGSLAALWSGPTSPRRGTSWFSPLVACFHMFLRAWWALTWHVSPVTHGVCRVPRACVRSWGGAGRKMPYCQRTAKVQRQRP